MEKLELEKIANNIRKETISMIHNAKSGHPGGALSATDIFTYLYFNEMNVDPKDEKNPDRDRFVLSKGHTVPALYAVLAEKGYFSKDILMTYRKMGTILQGHPDIKKTPGLDMSTGSLGQGISAAVGMALGGKLKNKDYRVYTLVGDGEIDEGQVWEALMFASHRKLDNLCVIVDNNGLQLDGTIDEIIGPNPLDEKFESFGCHVIKADGHDFDSLEKAFNEAKTVKGQPTVIIAKTVKGKGVSFMENNVSWHGAVQIECGIAEANMVGMATGISTTGIVPFVSSFAMFTAGRAFDQLRNSVGYPHLNVKVGATHGGISVGQDGATHQCNEDFALMRTIPGMVVICPSDDVEARAAVKAAYEYKGPVYMRFGRVAVPVINDNPDYKFEIGKGVTLKDGNDLTIIANGILVSEALQAAEMLAKDGINARVINIHTIKPLDKDLVIKAAKETGKIVTVEEHSVIGGLGSAVADVVSEENLAPVHKIGVQDVFGESALAEELLEKHGLDAKGIYNNIKDYLNK